MTHSEHHRASQAINSVGGTLYSIHSHQTWIMQAYHRRWSRNTKFIEYQASQEIQPIIDEVSIM